MKRWNLPGDHGFFVYLLLNDSEVVYVGQSTSLLTRLAAHASAKDFTSVRVYQFLTLQEMEQWEARLIRWFAPHYNVRGIPKEILDARRHRSAQHPWWSA